MTQEVEQPGILSQPVHPLVLGGGMAALSLLLGGEDTTLADRAAFIAYPFVLGFAANAGAQAGAKAAWESLAQRAVE